MAPTYEVASYCSRCANIGLDDVGMILMHSKDYVELGQWIRKKNIQFRILDEEWCNTKHNLGKEDWVLLSKHVHPEVDTKVLLKLITFMGHEFTKLRGLKSQLPRRFPRDVKQLYLYYLMTGDISWLQHTGCNNKSVINLDMGGEKQMILVTRFIDRKNLKEYHEHLIVDRQTIKYLMGPEYILAFVLRFDPKGFLARLPRELMTHIIEVWCGCKVDWSIVPHITALVKKYVRR